MNPYWERLYINGRQTIFKESISWIFCRESGPKSNYYHSLHPAHIGYHGSSGDDSITEESLYDEYGKVVTSTGKSFLEQMNLRFPQYTTTMNKYQI